VLLLQMLWGTVPLAGAFPLCFPVLFEPRCWGLSPHLLPRRTRSSLRRGCLPSLPRSSVPEGPGTGRGTWGRAGEPGGPGVPPVPQQRSPRAVLSLQMWHAAQVASALPPASLLLPGSEPAASPLARGACGAGPLQAAAVGNRTLSGKSRLDSCLALAGAQPGAEDCLAPSALLAAGQKDL